MVEHTSTGVRGKVWSVIQREAFHYNKLKEIGRDWGPEKRPKWSTRWWWASHRKWGKMAKKKARRVPQKPGEDTFKMRRDNLLYKLLQRSQDKAWDVVIALGRLLMHLMGRGLESNKGKKNDAQTRLKWEWEKITRRKETENYFSGAEK